VLIDIDISHSRALSMLKQFSS